MESIDIFDTALFRKVYEPADLFKLMEEQVGRNFYNERIEAEKLAHKKFRHYTLKDIYKFLPQFNLNFEIQMEFKYCYANPKILEMYNKNPENYVFISDMYLSSVVLQELLKNNGYINPRVYVSCECNASKRDGALFKYVLKKHNITRHYGDNYKSDIIQARNNGIEPIFMPCTRKKNYPMPIIKSTLFKKYISDCYNYEDPVERLAAWYTPLIYQFTKWVLSERKEGQTIYFLSRDMYLPYEVATNYFKAKDIKYLHMSRRSLAPIILQKTNNGTLIEKIKNLLSKEDLAIKSRTDITPCLEYIKNMGIKNGDIIVDVGYAGTVQAVLRYLGLELSGLYMQVHHNPYSVNLKSFFERKAFMFLLLMEFTLCSDEDSIEGYENGQPLFVPDNEQRKKYARKIKKVVFDNIAKMEEIPLSIFDIEQLMIHIQYYPDDKLLELFNSKIYTNREKIESGIGFDRDRIMKGEIIECYNESYAQPLFKKLLERDVDLAYLSNLLPQ